NGPAEKEHLTLKGVSGAELVLIASEEPTDVGGRGDLGTHREDIRSDASKRVRDVRTPIVRHLPFSVTDHPAVELHDPRLPGGWPKCLSHSPLQDEVIAHTDIYALMGLVSRVARHGRDRPASLRVRIPNGPQSEHLGPAAEPVVDESVRPVAPRGRE